MGRPKNFDVMINGVPWRIYRAKPREAIEDRTIYAGQACWGKCYYRSKTIRIARDLTENQLLDTAIHETLHAALRELSEETVSIVASDIAKVLSRLGFGLKKNGVS